MAQVPTVGYFSAFPGGATGVYMEQRCHHIDLGAGDQRSKGENRLWWLMGSLED